MEGPHPATLTDDDGAAQILLRGIDDWVSLAEARSLVSMVEPGRPTEVHEATLRAITLLVEHELILLGDLVAIAPMAPAPEGGRMRPPPVRFDPWPVDGEAALTRIRREWWDPERDLDPGNICWLQNTPAGDEIARGIEAARGT